MGFEANHPIQPASHPATAQLHALLYPQGSHVCICGGLWFCLAVNLGLPCKSCRFLVAHILCDEPLHETEPRVKKKSSRKKCPKRILRVGEALWEIMLARQVKRATLTQETSSPQLKPKITSTRQHSFAGSTVLLVDCSVFKLD